MAGFEDKTVVVTGAGRGIGRAIALGFGAAGAKVVVAEIDRRLAEQTLALLPAGRGLVVQVDVSQAAAVEALAARTVEHFATLDILVNNAAVVNPALLLDSSEADFEHIIGVNLKGCFLCCRAAGRAMIAQGRGGRIVNISTINAQRAEPYYGLYTASKSGLEGLTRTLAAELGPYGITVNAVAPGAVITEISKYVASQELRTAKARTIPLGRLAEAEDIVPAVMFFASEGAGYVTGQILHVDGGSFINSGRTIDWT